MPKLPTDKKHNSATRSGSNSGWLNGRHILVTGASGGIGAAISEGMLDRVRRITLVSRGSGGRLEALAEQLRERANREGYDVDVQSVRLDVNDWEASTQLLSRLHDEEGGAVDGLVYCAGGCHLLGSMNEQGRSDIDRILDTNLRAALYWFRLVLPYMAKRFANQPSGVKNGHIVVLSSRSGERALPGLSTYAVAKAGLGQLVEAARTEYARFGIAFTTVCPGSIVSTFTAEWDKADEEAHNAESMDAQAASEPILYALDAWLSMNHLSYQSVAQWLNEPTVLKPAAPQLG